MDLFLKFWYNFSVYSAHYVSLSLTTWILCTTFSVFGGSFLLIDGFVLDNPLRIYYAFLDRPKTLFLSISCFSRLLNEVSEQIERKREMLVHALVHYCSCSSTWFFFITLFSISCFSTLFFSYHISLFFSFWKGYLSSTTTVFFLFRSQTTS